MLLTDIPLASSAICSPDNTLLNLLSIADIPLLHLLSTADTMLLADVYHFIPAL